MTDKSIRRMTLRQILTSAEKCSRELLENCHNGFLPRASEFREATRPVRRRSQYPTMVSVQNSLHRLQEASAQVQELATYLQEHLQAIREHAQRERVNRM